MIDDELLINPFLRSVSAGKLSYVMIFSVFFLAVINF